ncbi:MAG: MipA/OmpV family protein [Pseudomonadota bacterium]
MTPISRMLANSSLTGLVVAAVPAAANETPEKETTATSEIETSDSSHSPQGRPAQGTSQQSVPPAGPPPGLLGFNPVFDDTWATVGIGAGLVPSYSGSDDYVPFPLPLIVGRVGGVGISPNGPGFNLNVLSQAPSLTPAKTSFSFGPSFRFRNDRANQIEDDVVELATELDVAIELGVNGGVTFNGVLAPRDRLSLNAQVRWDVLDAHNGMLIEPGVSYFRPLDSGTALQISATASFVDDDFADYYYTVTPADAAATGLAEFAADGGLNSLGTLAILTFDLDGNLLNGGFSIYTIAGYSRLVGDAADTPFTADRGSANQLIAGIGVGYTF